MDRIEFETQSGTLVNLSRAAVLEWSVAQAAGCDENDLPMQIIVDRTDNGEVAEGYFVSARDTIRVAMWLLDGLRPKIARVAA